MPPLGDGAVRRRCPGIGMPGDGGCAAWPVGEGESSRAAASTLMCDWDEFRGRPRRKLPKMLDRVGGESVVALCGLGSMIR